MTLAEQFKTVRDKAIEVGLKADFWNSIVLVITPQPDTTQEEKQLFETPPEAPVASENIDTTAA